MKTSEDESTMEAIENILNSERLPEEFEKILYDNLWSLYEE